MTEATAAKWWNALRLMRIPFSIFLMPVFWFALLNVHTVVWRAILVFIVLHVFMYPASNGYNSYFDRDEQSIGGLKRPPKVTRELWELVILFDLFAACLASFINPWFALMVIIYLLISKAYSWDKTRLKKYPVIGAITVCLFQGLFTYISVQVGAGATHIFTFQNLLFGFVSTLFLLGSYPMTQIYQHEEDAKHGDRTLSLLLGVNGTFLFAAVVFLLASVLLVILFFTQGQLLPILIYLLATLPVNFYFLSWFFEFRMGKPVITFERTMILNMISSLFLSLAFILMLILKNV